MTDRNKAVKELFENTAQYLKYDYNVRIRKETVRFFNQNIQAKNIFDMPCGNAGISAQLLNSADHLTLMDVSENMIRLAAQNIPEHFKNKTEFLNSDFFSFDFKNGTFDLVICLGLLAHVESPETLITKLQPLVKAGGHLIIQNTDSKHFYNYLIRFYLGIKNLFRKQTYKLNNFPGKELESLFQKNGFHLVRTFRYNQSFLGFSNLFSNERKYKLTQKLFGSAEKPKNQSWGSDVTYLFKKTT